MKQLIVPIAIIVALIAFFVIIDRKEFSRNDDVQTVQSESLTINRKPTVSVSETKPVTEVKPAAGTKPVEMKPVVETKPAEVKPVAETKPAVKTKPVVETKPAEVKPVETKPAEAKPVEAKPAETKPVAETKPEEKLQPAAVPVATPEEAKKLNEEAKEFVLAEKERREPFYKFYQDVKLDSVCFQGTIQVTSTIPDPEKNAYDNCLYALFIELDSYLADKSLNQKMPCEAVIAVPIIKDKIINESNIFQPGDKVICTCAEYDTMPQGIQEIQLSDDIQSYEHQLFYSMTISKVSKFLKGGNRNFSKREITVFPIRTIPKEEKISTVRKERIQNEIQRIEEELKKHGGTFESWKEEYKTVIKEYEEMCMDGYKGWIKDSFFSAKKNSISYKTKDYIEAILPYKQYLEDNNIDIIVVRVPSKEEFAKCVLTSELFQEDPFWIEHYYECLRNDIEIVDPMPEMWKHKFDFPLFYFYNDPTEYHPGEGYSFITAKVLSEVLKRYSYPVSEKPMVLEDFIITSKQPRFFWPDGNTHFNPNENIHFKRVIQNNKIIGKEVILSNSESPILFLSASLFGFPSMYYGACVPSYTAYFIQHIPCWFYQEGVANPMLRNLIANSQVLSGKKVVIMSADPNFWDGSFPPFPKYISDKATKISLEKTIEFLSPEMELLDDGSFLFDKDEDGLTNISQNTKMGNANNTFRIEISLPDIKEKSTCMLRVNFGTNSFFKINILNASTGQVIDSGALSPGSNLHPDFFIPISDPVRITIEFKPSYASTHKFSIRNIELWYY